MAMADLCDGVHPPAEAVTVFTLAGPVAATRTSQSYEAIQTSTILQSNQAATKSQVAHAGVWAQLVSDIYWYWDSTSVLRTRTLAGLWH